MAINGVLRIPQNDSGDSFVLIQAQSKGAKLLDLKLIGTEGEAPYVAKLQHDRVSLLKISNSPVSDSEWQSILESFFQQKPLQNIQASAAVQNETSIAITLRKQVQGITQRLGTITLKHEPDEAIELFEWCATAAEAAQTSRQSAIEASDKMSVLEASVKELKEQLQELIKAKKDDETTQLQKFCDLLNEKKVKIREQQRLLATGLSMQAKEAQKSAETDVLPTSRQPAKSRPGKRKANSSKTASQVNDMEEGESDDEPLPAIKTEPEDTDDGNTTDRTASTADEDGDEDQNMDKNDAVNPSSGTVGSQERSQQVAPKKASNQPPPRRDLPFLNKKATKLAAAHEESDSDDEL